MKIKLQGTVVIISLLILGLFSPLMISPAKADFTGALTVNSDGSVTPGAPISDNGLTYTLTGNFTGSVNIQKSNIIFDGAGYTVTSDTALTVTISSSASNVTVCNLKIDHGNNGVYLNGVQNCTFINNTITNVGSYGFYTTNSKYINILNNSISQTTTAIYNWESTLTSDYFLISGNNFTTGGYGIEIWSSSNTITNNFIRSGQQSLYLAHSTDISYLSNLVVTNNTAISTGSTALYASNLQNSQLYYNNFIDGSSGSGSSNTWDNGYPAGGNYWSGQNHTDQYSGSAQDIPGSDGIVDTSYGAPGGTDRYPYQNPIGLNTINMTIVGSGSTNLNQGINWERTNDYVLVTQSPATDGEFINWIVDGINVTDPTLTLTMDKDYNVTAVFKQVYYTLTVNESFDGDAYASGDAVHPIDGTQIVQGIGTTLQVEAQPVQGCQFYCWLLDGQSQTNNPFTVTFDQNHTLQAVFISEPLYLLPSGSDWPMMMHNSSLSGATDSAGPSSANILWRFQTGSSITASPVALNGVVYFGSTDGYLYAVNATTAKKIWAYNMNSPVLTTPAVANDIVFVAFGQTIYGLNATTTNPDGELLWSDSLSSTARSPVVAGNAVYVTAGSGIYAYSANPSKDQLWSYTAPSTISSSPAVSDGKVYFNSGSKVYVLNASPSGTDGELLWTYDTASQTGSSIAVANGRVYTSDVACNIYAFDATTDNNTAIWCYTPTGLHGVSNSPSLAATDDAVYSVVTAEMDGYVYALDATTNVPTGSQLWSYRFMNMGGGSSTPVPVIADDIVYIEGLPDVFVRALNAHPSGSSAETIWSYWQVTGTSTPAIANGVLFASSNNGYLYAFAPSTLVVFTQTGLGNDISWSATLNGVTQTTTLHSITFASSQTGNLNYSLSVPTGYTLNCTSDIVNVGTDPIFIPVAYSLPQYSLTINVVGTGCSVMRNPSQETYTAGTTVQLTPVAANGYSFSGWDGDLTGASNPATVIMDENKTVNATFIQNTYTLTMLTTGEGEVSPGNATSYHYGDSVDIKAMNTPGWSFAGWTGNASGTSNTTITMTGNLTITATFAENSYILTMLTVGSGSVIPGNTTCTYGQVIDLKAINANGWYFDGWSGDVSEATNTTITITSNMTVTATFAENNYILTMFTVGTGSVNPGNQSSYHYGDNITITAICSYPWVFNGWSGSTSGANNKTITITSNMTITASFIMGSHTITVNQASHGTITPGTVTVAYGESQTFIISPDTGYHIVDVIVDSSSLDALSSYQFTNVQSDHAITAIFAPNEYTLTVTTVGNGSVITTPETTTYNYGDIVQLNAIPNNGWVFNGWSGDISGITNTTITMDKNKNVIANFTKKTYQIDFALNGVSSELTGIVLTVDGVGYTTTDLPKSFNWTHDSAHNFSFNSTSQFTNSERYAWSSTTGLSTLQTSSITVTQSGTITSTFTTQYLLTVTAGHGNVTGAGWYNAGTTATSTVSQQTIMSGTDTRFVFDGWTGDVQGAQASVSILMDEPKTVTANWETQYQVTVNGNPSTGGVITPSTTTWTPAGTIDVSCTSNSGYSFASWSSTAQITLASPSSSATTATINGPGTITANFEQYTTIQAQTSTGKTDLKLQGNISSSQISNVWLIPSSKNTVLSFSVTGKSGTVGFTNITLPKSSVPAGTKPLVYIDGVLAANQGYTQDADNYYVWFTTHFSEHEISIEFTSDDATPTSTITPTSTASSSSTSSQQPSTSDSTYLIGVAIVIGVGILFFLLVWRRRKKDENEN
jgi:uncharacterized repeat protein (TIGR02543 family)